MPAKTAIVNVMIIIGQACNIEPLAASVRIFLFQFLLPCYYNNSWNLYNGYKFAIRTVPIWSLRHWKYYLLWVTIVIVDQFCFAVLFAVSAWLYDKIRDDFL